MCKYSHCRLTWMIVRLCASICAWQQEIANRSKRAVEIDVQDVEAWDQELANNMRMNTRRYQTLLSDAVEACLPEPDAELAERDVCYPQIPNSKPHNYVAPPSQLNWSSATSFSLNCNIPQLHTYNTRLKTHLYYACIRDVKIHTNVTYLYVYKYVYVFMEPACLIAAT